ncbi:flagellar hook-basal body complex protein FliE [Thalassoglobus polymorphus]|uniref:Flagellar hook-basal body complex protein FliE n=1 Tax=Thalassoglobus polymorphus TaxID=2527994 RepID=A0A517QME7_9PLAN|nr:flagellar hook-basal body complex protein FliE [Thalassoglobus polymorphus]QDT32814.1 flagellar hook-basal body protein FliE [Thalassoglobus polymorphus]
MSLQPLNAAAITSSGKNLGELQSSSFRSQVGESQQGLPFAELVSDMIHEVDAQQQVVAEDVQRLASGEIDNLQQVATNVAKADLSFRFLMEIRDRLITSYQEVMRMQV